MKASRIWAHQQKAFFLMCYLQRWIVHNVHCNTVTIMMIVEHTDHWMWWGASEIYKGIMWKSQCSLLSSVTRARPAHPAGREWWWEIDWHVDQNKMVCTGKHWMVPQDQGAYRFMICWIFVFMKNCILFIINHIVYSLHTSTLYCYTSIFVWIFLFFMVTKLYLTYA